MKIFFGLMLALTLSFGGYLIFGGRPGGEETDPEQKENNVTRVDGQQIIEIRGWLPATRDHCPSWNTDHPPHQHQWYV